MRLHVLSVVEHGVDLEAYFREMSRVLRPGGLLLSSTDYWETKIETVGKEAYGGPVHIFCREEIESAPEPVNDFETPTVSIY